VAVAYPNMCATVQSHAFQWLTSGWFAAQIVVFGVVVTRWMRIGGDGGGRNKELAQQWSLLTFTALVCMTFLISGGPVRSWEIRCTYTLIVIVMHSIAFYIARRLGSSSDDSIVFTAAVAAAAAPRFRDEEEEKRMIGGDRSEMQTDFRVKRATPTHHHHHHHNRHRIGSRVLARLLRNDAFMGFCRRQHDSFFLEVAADSYRPINHAAITTIGHHYASDVAVNPDAGPWIICIDPRILCATLERVWALRRAASATAAAGAAAETTTRLVGEMADFASNHCFGGEKYVPFVGNTRQLVLEATAPYDSSVESDAERRARIEKALRNIQVRLEEYLLTQYAAPYCHWMQMHGRPVTDVSGGGGGGGGSDSDSDSRSYVTGDSVDVESLLLEGEEEDEGESDARFSCECAAHADRDWISFPRADIVGRVISETGSDADDDGGGGGDADTQDMSARAHRVRVESTRGRK
jgi:hypothetical protein